jgi:hypothetical protein
MVSGIVNFVHIDLQNWIKRNFSPSGFKMQISAFDLTLRGDGNVLSYLIVNNRSIVRELE